MKLFHCTNSSRYVSTQPAGAAQKNCNPKLGERFISKLVKVFNSICPFGKRNSYTLNEMHISSPVKGCVPSSVFSVVPEKLKQNCKDGMITVDRNHFLKEKISLVSSIDGSGIGTRLPENKNANLELIDARKSDYEYQCKDWDYTPASAWD